jgi:son of sevenless-like protein
LKSRNKSGSSFAEEMETVPPLPSSIFGQSQTSLYRHRTSASVSSLPRDSIDERQPSNSLFNASLNTALHDPVPVLRTAADGKVEAGTFEALVHRLFTDTGRTQEDVSYRYIFLASYRIFTSSEHLFNTLRAHHDAMDTDDSVAVEDREGKRYS